MHLSLLADTFLSDSLADAGDASSLDEARASSGRRHLEGVLRGVVFICLLAVPFGLTFGAEALHANTTERGNAATHLAHYAGDPRR